MRTAKALAAATIILPLSAAPALGRPDCSRRSSADGLPGWLTERRATVLVDSVLLSGERAIRRSLPCWRLGVRGRPALMIRMAEQELRRSGRPVAPLVVVGIGYNSLFERYRKRFGYWSARWDREANRLLRTLRRLGARQIVWVTLREPDRRNVPPRSAGDLRLYSWYFPYVNARLRRLDRRNDDVILAEWRLAGERPGVTYDTIHLNAFGGRLMAQTIERAFRTEARRRARARRG